MVDHCRVLNDGQPQSGAANLLGAAFIHPIKPFKNPLPTFLRYSDAGIGDRYANILGIITYLHLYAAACAIIFDCIIAKIEDHAVKHRWNTIYHSRLSPQSKGHVRLGCF